MRGLGEGMNVSEEYLFPEVYVEGVRSEKCLCGEREEFFKLPCNADLSHCLGVYGQIPYEQALNYIDLIEAKTKATLIVVKDKPGASSAQGFLVEKNTEVCLQQVSGDFVYFFTREGSTVKKYNTIAYIVTGKFEVRNVRSICEGLVALIIDMPWEVPRKALVVVTHVYRPVTARKST